MLKVLEMSSTIDLPLINHIRADLALLDDFLDGQMFVFLTSAEY